MHKTSIGYAVFLLYFLSSLTSGFLSHGQSSQAAENGTKKNRSVDAAFDAVIPEPTPVARLRYTKAFFITNRRIDPSEEEKARSSSRIFSYENYFLNVPDVGVAYGYATISYPANRRRGNGSRGRSSTDQNPLYDFSVQEHFIFSNTSAFFEAIRRYYPNDNAKSLLYIHGLNNTFSDAAQTIAQLTTDLQYEGLPLFFSWPSDYNMNETSLALQYNQVKSIAVTSEGANKSWCSPTGARPVRVRPQRAAR
jgi:hypothetical protein